MVTITRSVVRKVATLSRDPRQKVQQLVVALTPEGIWINEYRRRRQYGRLLPYSAALLAATKLSVDAMRAEKGRPRAKAKKVKRGKLS
jgi:hypothetical protein